MATAGESDDVAKLADSFNSLDHCDSLTECAICLQTIRQPKALPCLHTFCLQCLDRYANNASLILCPLCKKEVEMPEDGVDGLPNNFMVTRMLERKEMDKSAIHCADCKLRTVVLLVYKCIQCDKFLCEECATINHDIHSVQSYKDWTDSIKSNICECHPEKEAEHCCKTCMKLICKQCWEYEHSSSTHEVVSLKNITDTLRELSFQCEPKKAEFEYALARYKEMKAALATKVDKTRRSINLAATNACDNYRKKVHECQKEIHDKLSKWQQDAGQTVDENIKVLEGELARLTTGLGLFTEMEGSGSSKDILEISDDLQRNLQHCKDYKHPIRQNIISVKFRVNTECVPEIGLGNLMFGARRASKKCMTWENTSRFADADEEKLRNGRNVALFSNGDIAVTDDGVGKVNIYDCNRELKLRVDTKTESSGKRCHPEGIVISSDSNIIVTDSTPYVKIFDAAGEFKAKFPSISPSGVPSDEESTKLQGLAITDNSLKECLLVGEARNRYIGKHQYHCGKIMHICSMYVGIVPQFLVAIPNGNIAVSACNVGTDVHIIDTTGQTLFTLNAPTVCYWKPTGLAHHPAIVNTLFVANFGEDTNDSGIFCFSYATGQYLGCANNNVICPKGLAISNDGKQMFVVVRNGIDILEST